METVVKNIRDLDQTDRSALERVVGCQLCETHQVIVNVVDLDREPTAHATEDRKGAADVPDWWNIYEGLSDEEVDELDQAIRQRADLSRHFE